MMAVTLASFLRRALVLCRPCSQLGLVPGLVLYREMRYLFVGLSSSHLPSPFLRQHPVLECTWRYFRAHSTLSDSVVQRRKKKNSKESLILPMATNRTSSLSLTYLTFWKTCRHPLTCRWPLGGVYSSMCRSLQDGHCKFRHSSSQLAASRKYPRQKKHNSEVSKPSVLRLIDSSISHHGMALCGS